MHSCSVDAFKTRATCGGLQLCRLQSNFYQCTKSVSLEGVSGLEVKGVADYNVVVVGHSKDIDSSKDLLGNCIDNYSS